MPWVNFLYGKFLGKTISTLIVTDLLFKNLELFPQHEALPNTLIFSLQTLGKWEGEYLILKRSLAEGEKKGAAK